MPLNKRFTPITFTTMSKTAQKTSSTKSATAAAPQNAAKNTEATRPPVVVIMGHVDHGKSTLLDYIRKTNVVDKEVGGITQRMSSYEVAHNNKPIVFIDTPGHESFNAIRARGASAADIAILIVSAEDGVKPQTIDAFKAIKTAGLQYIVGISKIDKDNANIERTKQSLAENEVYVEGYGGSIPWVGFSGKTGTGIPELLDMILLLAEVEDFKADASAQGQGIVIESNRDKVRGISATIIVKDGTVETGTYVVSGKAQSPVRILENFLGKPIKSAGPSTPVRIVGWSEEPEVGGICLSFATRKEAEQYIADQAGTNAAKATQAAAAAKVAATVAANATKAANIAAGIKDVELMTAVVPVMIKADTSGSVEAVRYEIQKLTIDRVTFKIVGASIGDISENDVKSAAGSSDTIILGFNCKADAQAKSVAERHGMKIQTFDIIYKLTEWLTEEAKTRTPKMETEEQKGIAKILKIFSVTKDKQVLGGRVEAGTVSLNDEVKILRRDADIGRGRIRELQQAKAKTSSVEEGKEFGMMVESKIELAPGDKIEAFHVVLK